MLIDIDETGFYLKDINTKYGRSHTTCRVRTTANYTRSQQRLNVIVAIKAGNAAIANDVSGSINRPRRWVFITKDNVNQFIFGDFVNTVLTDIEEHQVPGGHDNSRCILWDNLSVHKTAYVTHLIRDCLTHHNFFSVDHPPYRPKIAPIEYFSVNCQQNWQGDATEAGI